MEMTEDAKLLDRCDAMRVDDAMQCDAIKSVFGVDVENVRIG